ncbi:uncharacterized protein LOC134079454 [Sardina pilchardus]|uniref:uncharacterized protein LOC134079454 n=1 Tax=Sardina pilchardus TaxID=27697 RepID=UPI002E0FCDEF
MDPTIMENRLRFMMHIYIACLQCIRGTTQALLILVEDFNRLLLLLQQCNTRPSQAYLGLPMPEAPQTQRGCWMKVRSRDWWDRVVLQEFTDEDWKANFRMSRQSFAKLCDLMKEVMKPDDNPVRQPVPLNMRVAIVLYKLASCAEYRVVANQFGVHKSTVLKFVTLFCKGMVTSVMHQLIRTPTLEEARRTARRFEEKFHLPQIIGCIDGTHIPILAPSDGFKDFVNRKGWPSYVLQAVVDDTYRFWNISCKMPGSAHDANVLRQSVLFEKAHLLPKDPKDIHGTSVDFYLLGDPAYPLLPWIMKGYISSPRQTPEQESFNVYLSSARTTVEIAFGRLKSRWRVLLKRSDFHFTLAPYVIATCCALHNFCESEKETMMPTWLEEAVQFEEQLPQPGARPHNTGESGVAQRVRQTLTEYMAALHPLRRREL